MRIFELARKDLVQIFRDKKSLLFLIAMPIVFTVFMGFAMGQSDQGTDNRLPVGWINSDPEGLVSQELYELCSQSAAIRPVQIEKAEAEQELRDGKLSAVLTVPPNFSNSILENEPAQLLLLIDPATNTGGTSRQTIQTNLVQVLSKVKTAQLITDQLNVDDEASRQTVWMQAYTQAQQGWRSPTLTISVEKASGSAQKDNPNLENQFNQSSPGMIVQFIIFGLITSAMVLVLERQSGSLQRLLTTSMHRSEIISGHLIAMFLIILAQELILAVFGQIFFDVNYLRQPLATLLVMTALALWAASLGMLIGTLAKKEDQVILYTMIAMFLFSALGGAWFPLEVAGKVFSQIGKWTPGAFAMNGFQNILIRGLSLDAVLIPSLALVGFSLVCFVLSVWQFKKEI